ncbi:MAG: glycoside hydrolase family 43 protein [Agriterribacter sp.]
MKKLFLCFVLVSSCITTNNAQGIQDDSSIYFADPTIFHYKNKFYLCGTNGFNSDSGFYMAVSGDLQHWKKTTGNKRVLTKGVCFGTKGFWAPQLLVHHNKIYMAYTANEHIAIAESNRPTGPFRQKIFTKLEAPVKQIDPFIFKDDDGKIYLYHVRLQDGNRIFGAALKDDLSAIDTSTLRECISAVINAQPWENTQSVKWTVTEGPTVLKQGKKYYMFYSANDFRNPDYAVGYATADHPLGPWKKSDQNPIISRQITRINGPGHGDIVSDAKGNLFYVFHTHYSNDKVAPRKTAIIKILFEGKADHEKIKLDESSFRYLKYD